MSTEPRIKPQKQKRKIDILVLSDIHLGTYGCHAKELMGYLKSVKPKTVILNGDIIDMWQFSKRYFPKEHLNVIHKIMKWVNNGVKVYYLPGNHDEYLRRFVGFQVGNLSIENKLLLNLNGRKTWIFHGDVFDVTMQHSKWLTKLGATGYDLLIHLNSVCNWILIKMGRQKISLSRTIKNSVKEAVKYINNFETVCAEIAYDNGYQDVICGHIHHPEIKMIGEDENGVRYLNSGDWIENLTSLEYRKGEWQLYKYDPSEFTTENNDTDEDNEDDSIVYMKNREIFQTMLDEFNFTAHNI